MYTPLMVILTLVSGVCWSIVYVSMIKRGFQDKTYGMPLFALAFNLSWEFMFSFLVDGGFSLQKAVNILWFVLDVIIVYTYFKFGRQDFPEPYKKWFVPWSLAAFMIGFAVIYYMHLEFDGYWGAIYAAFFQNLLMSGLFIGLLVRRGSVSGQSLYIAVFKCIGTLAPSIQFYLATGNRVILVLGIGILFYDMIYIGMLYQKFKALRMHPLTRRPLS